jgi:large subunit ribosomal protein L24
LPVRIKAKKARSFKSFPKDNAYIVEGVNMVKKHQKATQKVQQGGIVTQEAPVHVSNVMYFEKKANKGVRVGYKILNSGEKVRVSKKTGEVLD